MDPFHIDENLFNKISMNCLIMNMNINSIQQEVDKIADYLGSLQITDNIINNLQNYNIAFQKIVLEKQLQQFKEIKIICFNKIYKDLFMLYSNVITYLFELDKTFHVIEDLKETPVIRYITKCNIIPVNDDINIEQAFKINEIDDLYKNLMLRLEDHKRYIKEIDFFSREINTSGRLRLFSQGMDVQNKKLQSEVTNYYTALNMILNNNRDIYLIIILNYNYDR